VALPEGEDYDTVAGLVLQVLGRIPSAGDEAVVPLPTGDDEDEAAQQAVLTVDYMDGLRIDRLSLRVEEVPQTDE
jgi:CBS domain containing-hemolysin-like protein